MKRFFAAWGFLTIIPCPMSHQNTDTLGKSVPCYPLVGAILGCMAYGAVWLFAHGLHLPPAVGAVLLTILLGAFSGGLHLDGLADTADGFLSSRPRERILEIMRDSRIGAMGVLGLFAVLALKIAALASLPLTEVLISAAMMPLAGRVAIVISMSFLPYARQDGLATIFYMHRRHWHAVWAVLFLAGIGFLFWGLKGLSFAIVTVVICGIWALVTFRKIGGATGDTLGAGCEFAECGVPLAMLTLLPYDGFFATC